MSGRSLLRTAALLLLLTPAACQNDVRGDVTRAWVAGADPELGRATFARYGCSSCHTIPGVPGARGRVGPPLLYWPERAYIAGMVPNQPRNLVQFIRSPQSIAPGTAMPILGVTDRDARNMAAYLYSLD